MALTQFIKELLYLNDKIIIPGFGGFVAHYVPSRINPETNILTPPAKNFTFDTSLTEDDGVFTTYVSSRKSLSIHEASQAVQEMVQDFRKKLNDGNTLFIEEVGYLFQDDNKVIRFKKDEERNYHPESYGFGPIVLKTTTREEIEEEESFYPVSRKRSIVKILVIFLILNAVGALSAFIYWKFDNIRAYFQKFSEEKIAAPVRDTTTYKVSPDTTGIGQKLDTSTNIKNALRYEQTENQYPPVSQSEVADKIYYIIAGSFQTFEKAELHAKLLSKQGLKPEVIEFSQELYRISVGEYKGKEEALEKLELIKCKKGAEKAWLLAK